MIWQNVLEWPVPACSGHAQWQAQTPCQTQMPPYQARNITEAPVKGSGSVRSVLRFMSWVQPPSSHMGHLPHVHIAWPPSKSLHICPLLMRFGPRLLRKLQSPLSTFCLEISLLFSIFWVTSGNSYTRYFAIMKPFSQLLQYFSHHFSTLEIYNAICKKHVLQYTKNCNIRIYIATYF